jgi:hypothetical protein
MGNVSIAHEDIAQHCAEIAKLFKPGALVTVVVRNPGYGVDGSADMLISDDDPELVIKALEYLRQRRNVSLGEPTG